MKSIAMIVCLTVVLLSITSGLVSGEAVESNNSRVFITDHRATTPVAGDLQVNVDNTNIYPAANRCKFEGAMLVGHGVAAVVGERRVLRIADNIGESGQIVKTKAGGTIEYVKGGASWTARWVEGAGFKLGIIHYVSWWDELSQPALDGWNKALKNVDRGTGKELLEDLGKGRADRAGKNLAGMSDDAAEWMAESEIGRTTLKGWGDDAQKGLAEIYGEKGERFTGNLARRFGDEVEIVSKGVGRGVIDVDQVNPEKLAVYVRGTGKIGVADPLDDIVGKQQLLRMMKSPHVTTEIVGAGGKPVETIGRVAVLKRGEHLGPNNGWGWEHIVGEDHHNQIEKKFGLRDNDAAVKEVISEVLEYGTVTSHIHGDTIKITKTVTRNSKSHDIRVVVSEKSKNMGSIQTVHLWDV